MASPNHVRCRDYGICSMISGKVHRPEHSVRAILLDNPLTSISQDRTIKEGTEQTKQPNRSVKSIGGNADRPWRASPPLDQLFRRILEVIAAATTLLCLAPILLISSVYSILADLFPSKDANATPGRFASSFNWPAWVQFAELGKQ